MSDQILSTAGLTFAYDDVVALSDIALEVPPGRSGLVGANGAGKTTLLKLMLGILQPGSGTVQVLGSNIPADTLKVRSRVGFMPETSCLPQDQSAADFIGYSAELAGIPSKAARQRASDILGLVGLAEERFRPMGEFSTGMAQRAKMAQALVHGPDLLLLDEPTAGLDPEGRDEMLDLITRIGDLGINVIVSSHVLGDIERTCDWIVMLDGGKVLRQGPIEGLSDQGIAEVEVLGDASAVVAALEAAGAEVRWEGRHIAVDHPDDPFIAVRNAVATTGATIRSLGARTTSLEDIFLAEETHDE